MKLATRAIRVGPSPDPATGAISTPIYQTVNFVFDDIGRPRAYEYSRSANPTRSALEECLASLEEAKFGLAFASGMAAVDAVLSVLRPGDHVVSSRHVYGGTSRLFEKVYVPRGVTFTYVEGTRPEAFADATRPATRWLCKVQETIYPGLPSHPQHDLATAQMDGFGAIVTLKLPRGREQAARLVKGLKLFLFAESLGGVESLVCHPATMSHASLSAAERESRGITEGTLRLSVGIEDAEDLVGDLERALASC